MHELSFDDESFPLRYCCNRNNLAQILYFIEEDIAKIYIFEMMISAKERLDYI